MQASLTVRRMNMPRADEARRRPRQTHVSKTTRPSGDPLAGRARSGFSGRDAASSRWGEISVNEPAARHWRWMGYVLDGRGGFQRPGRVPDNVAVLPAPRPARLGVTRALAIGWGLTGVLLLAGRADAATLPRRRRCKAGWLP